MVLALFDFDGTITKKDSFLYFLIYSKGLFKFLILSVPLTPILILYYFKIISNNYAKQIVFSFFFKGLKKEAFQNLSNKFSEKILDSLVKKKAIKKIKWHKNNNHKVVVVSASMENYLFYWCDKYQLDLIATKVEIVNGCLSGKFDGKNCYGLEKVSRIKKKINLNEIKKIYAYGDSKGDYEMLELADYKYLNYF